MSKKYFEYEGNKVPVKMQVSLMEAVHWIAAGIPPVDRDYIGLVKTAIDSLESQKIEKAKGTLFCGLKDGSLRSCGLYSVPKSFGNDLLDSTYYFDINTYSKSTKAKNIQSDLWRTEGISWNDGNLVLEDDIWVGERLTTKRYGYVEIQIATDDLMAFFSHDQKAGRTKQSMRFLTRDQKARKPKKSLIIYNQKNGYLQKSAAFKEIKTVDLAASTIAREIIKKGRWDKRDEKFLELIPKINELAEDGKKHHEIAQIIKRKKAPNGEPITNYKTSKGLTQEITEKSLSGLIKKYFLKTNRPHLIHGHKS